MSYNMSECSYFTASQEEGAKTDSQSVRTLKCERPWKRNVLQCAHTCSVHCVYDNRIECLHYSILTEEETARAYPIKMVNCVMMSGDSPPPLRTSIPSPGFDMPDNVRLGKTTSTPIVTKPSQPDAEVIEEDVPIMEKTVPVPESKPEIVMSGPDSDVDDEKSVVRNVDDDPCTIKCVYFLQQCCECTIL